MVIMDEQMEVQIEKQMETQEMAKGVETCKIQEKIGDEENGGKKEPRIIAWLTLLIATLGVIATFATLGWNIYKDKRDLSRESKEEQKEEMSFHPHFVMWRGGTAPVGLEDCYIIYLENSNNDITISSGTFGMEYLVVVENENRKVVLSWKGILLQPEVKYDREYKGCYFLINEDFYTCEWRAQEICLASGLEDAVCSSYIFFYFDYEQDGKKDGAYYLVEMIEEGRKGAIEVDEPDEYKESIRMNL